MILAVLLNLCTAMHAAALMVWFGALSLQRLLGLSLLPTERRALVVMGAIALASGLIWPWLDTGVLLNDPSAALDPSQVGALLVQTSFGQTWLWRQIFVLLALLAATVSLLESEQALYFLAAAALGSLALIGHAAAASGTFGALQRVVLGLHLLAAGAWLGALPLLWRQCGRQAPAPLAIYLRRFSRYGLVLVALVVLTGIETAVVHTGSVDALLNSTYGRILLTKVSLVGLMGIAAIINRNRLTPALERADGLAQEAGRRGLRRSIAVEIVLGLVVVGLASFLGAAEAPH